MMKGLGNRRNLLSAALIVSSLAALMTGFGRGEELARVSSQDNIDANNPTTVIPQLRAANQEPRPEDTKAMCAPSSLTDRPLATDCAGSFFFYRSRASASISLKKLYDLEEVKAKAAAAGMEAKIVDGQFVPRTVEDFNRLCTSWRKLKKNDHAEKGSLKVTVDEAGKVRIPNTMLIIWKKISDEECYQISIEYRPCPEVKQYVRVTQNGRCNFPSGYVKEQVKGILRRLDIETEWVREASVEVNHTYKMN